MKLFASLVDELKAFPVLGAPRSSQWPALRDAHLESEPWCRYCGTEDHLEVHHIRPFHLFPEEELDARNLITLCMTPGHACHFVIGHLGSWLKWNPYIIHEARWPRPMPSQSAALVALFAARASWGFSVEVEGDDLVMRNVRMTCFGGDSDPQDNGQTASGISTIAPKGRPDLAVCGVALPMDGREFGSTSEAFHRALDGSPIPRIPWLTEVDVQIGNKVESAGVIDLGPAAYTGNALDCTIAFARRFAEDASAVNFFARGNVRIRGAGRFMRKADSSLQ